MRLFDWELWDARAKQLKHEIEQLQVTAQTSYKDLDEELKPQRERVNQLNNTFDRQIDFLLMSENRSSPQTQKEKSYFHWVRKYARTLSEYASMLDKTMLLDLWGRLIQTRLTQGRAIALSPREIAVLVEQQIKKLVQTKDQLDLQLENLDHEEEKANRRYREIAVEKANKDALLLGQMKSKHGKNIVDKSTKAIISVQAGVVPPEPLAPLISATLPKSTAKSRLPVVSSSHSLLVGFDSEDLTHSL